MDIKDLQNRIFSVIYRHPSLYQDLQKNETRYCELSNIVGSNTPRRADVIEIYPGWGKLGWASLNAGARHVTFVDIEDMGEMIDRIGRSLGIDKSRYEFVQTDPIHYSLDSGGSHIITSRINPALYDPMGGIVPAFRQFAQQDPSATFMPESATLLVWLADAYTEEGFFYPMSGCCPYFGPYQNLSTYNKNLIDTEITLPITRLGILGPVHIETLLLAPGGYQLGQIGREEEHRFLPAKIVSPNIMEPFDWDCSLRRGDQVRLHISYPFSREPKIEVVGIEAYDCS